MKRKILADLGELKPFHTEVNRKHGSFQDIMADSLTTLNVEELDNWLRPRPHVSALYARCIWSFLYTLSRVEISVYVVYPDTCGRSYPYIFVYADVTVSEPVFFRARFSKMAASRNIVCSMLLGLLSSLIACLELNVAMLKCL